MSSPALALEPSRLVISIFGRPMNNRQCCLTLLGGAAIGAAVAAALLRQPQSLPPADDDDDDNVDAVDTTAHAAVPEEQLAPREWERVDDDTRLMRRIETVLSRRTARVIVVLERFGPFGDGSLQISSLVAVEGTHS